MSLFLPKLFLPRVKKETVQSNGKMIMRHNPSPLIDCFSNFSADLTIPVISVLRSRLPQPPPRVWIHVSITFPNAISTTNLS